MTVISEEPLLPSDHPLLHTWHNSKSGVTTANYSSSDKAISLSITDSLPFILNYGKKEGETGRKGSFPFNRVIGSTLAGDRIDFSSLAPRSMKFWFDLPMIPHKVEVNLATGSAVLGSGTWAGTTGSWGFQVQNFEDVTGSPFDDILIGNADSNKIIGGAGIDMLDGGAGNDTLDGGSGVDALTGGSGNNRFILADRGDLNADSITDFKAYVVRSQPDFTLPEISTSGGVILSGDDGGIFTGRPPGGVTPGGVILNDYAAIEDQGNTKLFSRIDGLAFVETGSGRRQEITSPWGSPAGNDSTEWQMMAADTIAGVNQILWRNNTSNFLHTWSLDANWTWQSSSGADPFNTPRAWELETIFQVDGNRDGITGAPFTTLEAQGDTKLLSRGDGKAFVEYGAGMRQEISSPWNSPVGNDSSEWQMVAAEMIAGTNQILWRNNTSNFLHTWSLDANWTWQSSSGADPFNTPRAWELETIFQVDGNRDGITGAPFTTLEAQGDTKLLSRGDGKAFVDVEGARQEISSPWNSPVGNDSSEWQMLAADTIAGANQVLWRNNTSSFLHIWNLDANWNWQASSGADAFNTPRAWELETSFQVDGNHDGIIGTPYTTLEAVEDDALILANRLDDGLVGASAAGIKGLTFSGGNGVGNTLAPTSFFKGAGLNGASFGAAAGIFVNTSSGDVFYNDAKEAGSYLIARLGAAGVAGITASDFLLG